MTLSLLWYVLAGVLLGFAASTLWEWLYFRNKRVKFESSRIQELEAQLADEQALNAQMRLAHGAASSPVQADYASPGVFLDSESEPEPSESMPEPVAAGSNIVTPGGESGAESSARASRTVDFEVKSRAEGVAVQTAMAAETDEKPQHVDSGSVLAAAATTDTRSASKADATTDAYVDALAEATDDEDDATRLERLAAELAPRPASAPPTASQPPRIPHVARSSEHPDNLSMIKGIGDVYKFRLYAAGIFTWHQVAETDVETLRVATHAYPGSNVEEWGPQARQLAEKHGRQGAYYDGPVPDDLTKIIGIGPVGERTLYSAGFCTYAQLAGATISELQELFPIAIAGDEPDFAQWIRIALDLANRKARD